MSIEVNRTRVADDGTVACDFTVPGLFSFSANFAGLDSYVTATRYLLGLMPDGFRPVPPPRAYSAAEQYDLRRACASHAVQKPIPRASVPPFVQDEATVIGGNAYPPDEPEALKAGKAFSSDETKVGGTD